MPGTTCSGAGASPSGVALRSGADRRWAVTLGIIVALAVAARFWRIDAQSLWYDEGWSIHLAQQSLRSALAEAASAGHTHPPGYYLLLMAWVRMFGDSVVAVRALSAVLGVTTVGATYWLGRVLFDRGTGLLAALLLSVAPAHIVYSQETRMYALLTLCFAVLLGLSYQYVRQRGSQSICRWSALIAVEIVAVYIHYFAVLSLLSISIWALAVLLSTERRGRVRALHWWVGAQLVVLVAFIPWLGVALQRAATHVAEGATRTGLAAFALQSWSFLMGGHIALLGRESIYATAAKVSMAAVGLLTLGSFIRDRDRSPVVYLCVQGLAPLGLVFGLMQLRPGFHPRYILMLLIPLIVLVSRGLATLARSGVIGRLAAVVVAGLWLSTMALAARALLSDPYYARDDARMTAIYLRERLQSGAIVLVDNQDWALRYYLGDAELVQMYLDVRQLAGDIRQQVTTALAGGSEAALIKWHQGETDRQRLLPYLLERFGTLIETRQLPGYTASVYALDREPSPPISRWVDISFGPLRLMEATVETSVPADEAVALQLTWRKDATVDRDYKVVLGLVDERERSVARSDTLLRDGNGADTSVWPTGQEVVNYYVLPVGPGIAPLAYSLQIGVYHEGDPTGLDVLDEAGAPAGKSYELGLIELTEGGKRTIKTVDRAKLSLRELPGSPNAADGLALQAYALDESAFRTGDPLSVLLEWRNATTDRLPDYTPALRLVRDERVLASVEEAPVYGRYPTSRWGADEIVLDWRDLLIPAQMAGGPAEIQVAVDGDRPISLGQIEIVAVPRLFTPPPRQFETSLRIGGFAELVGYDLRPANPVGGEEISVTLYWRAVDRGPKGYVVFTHLLSSEGNLIAQHDGPPASGERPTTGWAAGEFIVDHHSMRWHHPDYHGEALFEVGFYDPLTTQRVLTPGGDSRVLLPTAIIIH